MIQSEIEQLLKPLVEDQGYELWGCEYFAQGKHSILRIYIDSENGVGIEDCQRVSRQISAYLDVEDPIAGHYSLEISSPGLPRQLFNKDQYKRYIGREIQIKLTRPVNGSRKLAGTIVSANENNLVLKVDDSELELQFSQILKAYLKGE